MGPMDPQTKFEVSQTIITMVMAQKHRKMARNGKNSVSTNVRKGISNVRLQFELVSPLPIDDTIPKEFPNQI